MTTIRRIFLTASMLLILGSYGNHTRADLTKTEFTTNKNIITAMTFNIRVDTFIDGWNGWDFRKDKAVLMITNNSPDILGLQEALNNQVEHIQGSLPQYDSYAVGRSNGLKKGEACAILYKKDRFIKLDCGTFWFSDTPNVPGSKDWGNFPPRICSWIELFDRQTATAFYVYNLHLDNLSQNSREKSVRLLTKKIAANSPDKPFIVMGDFNMEATNPAMKYMQNSEGPQMVDTWTAENVTQSGMGTRHDFSGRTIGPRIDHIRISPNLSAKDIKIDTRKIDGRYPSDHFPVIAKIELADISQVALRNSENGAATTQESEYMLP